MDSSVLGVRFQEAARIYYFEPGGYDELLAGQYVVVETSRGLELGRVVIAPGQVLSAELTEPLKPILRPATDEDLERADELKDQAHEATVLARSRAVALKLPMKVVTAQYTLDGSRLTVFFTSEGRVDFRELVHDLGQHVSAQVQLRQVGARDQAKLIGGYGRCGRRLCCTSWLTAFPAISIKMAKEQSLPLNPSKISGQCGRLLCCLSYENDVYKRLRAELPRPDSWVSTPAGNARVLALNAIRQIVTLQLENMQVVELTVAQLGLERGVTRPLGDLPEVAASAAEDVVMVVEREVRSITVVREERRGTVTRRVEGQRREGAEAPPAGEPVQPNGHRTTQPPQRPVAARAPVPSPPPANADASAIGAAGAARKRRRRHRRGGAPESGPAC